MFSGFRQPKKMPLHQITIDMMTEIIDGEVGEVPKILFPFIYLKDCNYCLRWLILKNLKGKKLIHWVAKENGGDLRKVLAYILKEVNSNNDLKLKKYGQSGLSIIKNAT